VLVAQKSAAKDEPGARGPVRDRQHRQHPPDAEAPDGTVKSAGRGQPARAISEVIDVKTHFTCRSRPLPADNATDHETEAMRRTMIQQFDQYVKLNKKIPPEILTFARGHRRSGAARATRSPRTCRSSSSRSRKCSRCST
jgi:ATP-dependent Lon protease